MSAGLRVLANTWRYRKALVLPTLLVPMLMAGWALSQPPRYEAAALIQVDTVRAKSPLLQHLTESGQETALNRILRGQNLLRDTAHDAGVMVDPAGVRLRVVNDNLLEISYTGPQEVGLDGLVDALATNFIYEILAPERLRVEQRLAATGGQLKDVKAKLADPAMAAEAPRLKLDEESLTAQYTELMADVAAINAAFNPSSPGGVMWFAEPSHIKSSSQPGARAWVAARNGVMIGLLLGFIWVGWRRARPRGFVKAERLVAQTQLPLAGALPNIGAVEIRDGKAWVTVGQTQLNPVEFTETNRLHRALTRNLHGALVITATAGGEGSSLLTALMALKSAVTGKRTLLVDLNLKNGVLTQAFGAVPADWGLAPVKSKGRGAGRFAMADVVLKDVAESGLDVLPLPSDKETLDLLATPEGAAALFDGLSSSYEHILVDTTPMTALNRHNVDPVTLAAAAGRTALVVLMARTPVAWVRQAAEQLVASGAHVVGVVANNRKNPSTKALLMEMARTLGHVAPGLATWLRAKVVASRIE